MELHEFRLEDHQFMASPNMEAIYVIKKADTDLPSIIASFKLVEAVDPLKAGLSIRLIVDDTFGEVIKFTDGFDFKATADRVKAGTVLIQTGDSRDGNTFVRLNAYFNGAVINNSNRTLTVAGIGITDILSADPLEVSLVNAPLMVVKDYMGGFRDVEGLHILYTKLADNPLTNETSRGLWEVTIILKPIPV